MKMTITVDMTGESPERQIEIVRQASRLAEEIRKEFGVPEENAPEGVAVTPEAVDRYDALRRRQIKRDRERLNDLGIHVDIFQSDPSED